MRHGVLAAEYRVGARRAIAGTLSGCVYPHGLLSLRLSRHSVTHLPGLPGQWITFFSDNGTVSCESTAWTASGDLARGPIAPFDRIDDSPLQAVI